MGNMKILQKKKKKIEQVGLLQDKFSYWVMSWGYSAHSVAMLQNKLLVFVALFTVPFTDLYTTSA